MAIFSKLVTTEKGLALIAQMLAGEDKIVFTKVCSSDSEYTLEELESLEELTGVRQTSSVSKISRTSDIAVKVETVFTNTELTEGYYMRTLALYAQDGEDGEILYAAAIETSGNCYVPAFGGVTVSGAYIQLTTTVSNAENVTVEVDNSVFATIGNIADLQQQIDAVGELAGSMASAINVNAAKLDMLEKIGSLVVGVTMSFGKSIPNEQYTEVDSIPQDDSTFNLLNNKTYYLYTLNESDSFTFTYVDGDFSKELEGFLIVNLTIGGDANYVRKVLPIVPWMAGENLMYAVASPSMMRIYGPPLFNGIRLFVQPYIYERVNGTLKKVEGNIRLSGKYNLSIYKLGGILANVQGSGTVEGGASGGTDNYNLLLNKPSINNVTLQGNLTSEELGLGSDTGSAVEMTYEEALTILNEEQEVTEE